MRLLLDECVDRRLAREILGHDVATVVGLGWVGVRNGALLARTAGQFDAFVTVDRNLAFQQRIDNLPFAVVVVDSTSKCNTVQLRRYSIVGERSSGASLSSLVGRHRKRICPASLRNFDDQASH